MALARLMWELIKSIAPTFQFDGENVSNKLHSALISLQDTSRMCCNIDTGQSEQYTGAMKRNYVGICYVLLVPIAN